VLQDFINGTEFKGIDFGVDYKSVLGCGRQLIKPSESGAVIIKLNFKEIT
jgi:hypothetical protein